MVLHRRGMQARDLAFTQLQSGGRGEIAAKQLSEAIYLGLLVDGEQFPSELDLAARMSISTVTLRDALVRLREEGLIETRRGRGGGSFVTCSPARMHAWLEDRIRGLSMHALGDGRDFASAIGGSAAELAARRASPAETARLAQQTERFERAASIADRNRADAQFHVALAAASQSVALTRSTIDASGEEAALRGYARRGDDGVAAVAREHADVLRAVKRGDGASARRAMVAHVEADFGALMDLHLQVVGRPDGSAEPSDA